MNFQTQTLKSLLEFVKEIEALGESIGGVYGKHQTGA